MAAGWIVVGVLVAGYANTLEIREGAGLAKAGYSVIVTVSTGVVSTQVGVPVTTLVDTLEGAKLYVGG